MRFVPAKSVCYLEFEVRDPAGVRVGPSGWGCIDLVPQPVELAPYMIVRADFPWPARTCSIGVDPGAICVDALPAVYTLRGLADFGGPKPLESPAVLVQVQPRR
jgi:hypothetical protein